MACAKAHNMLKGVCPYCELERLGKINQKDTAEYVVLKEFLTDAKNVIAVQEIELERVKEANRHHSELCGKWNLLSIKQQAEIEKLKEKVEELEDPTPGLGELLGMEAKE